MTAAYSAVLLATNLNVFSVVHWERCRPAAALLAVIGRVASRRVVMKDLHYAQ